MIESKIKSIKLYKKTRMYKIKEKIIMTVKKAIKLTQKVIKITDMITKINKRMIY